MKSRKTLMVIVAIFTAIFTFFQKELGLSIDAGQAAAGLGIIVVYLFGEFKNDLLRVKQQSKKFLDPAFLAAFASSILPVVNSEFGLKIPVELVIGILTVILGIIFRKRQTSLKNGNA